MISVSNQSNGSQPPGSTERTSSGPSIGVAYSVGNARIVGRARHARRPRPWPLHRLVELCPSAAAVFLALSDMRGERGSRVVPPTRSELRDRTSLSFETISKSLTALKTAGWIAREHIPVHVGNTQTATLLRITIFRPHSIGRRKAEKTGSTECSAVARKKAASGKSRRAEIFRHNSSFRRERSPLADVAASRATSTTTPENIATSQTNSLTPDIPYKVGADSETRFRLDLKTTLPFPDAIIAARQAANIIELSRLNATLKTFPPDEQGAIENYLKNLETNR